MSIYQRRWSSCGNSATPSSDFRRTTTASCVEPSTVGTSWNSVRWNKPSTSYRSSIASRFENTATSTPTPSYTTSGGGVGSRSRYNLSSAAKNAADVASIGPSVSARASRFDTANIANKEKYRSEARELINKWSSRERNSTQINNTYRSPIAASRPAYRSSDSLLTTSGSSSLSGPSSYTAYRTSKSLTPTRSSYVSSERKSVLSPSPTPYSSIHVTPKADRPWRQRMAESSRIRNTLGDDVSEAYMARRARNASSRRGSMSSACGGGGDGYETPSSLAPSRASSFSALGPTNSSYRSRQSSVESSVFTPNSRFTTSNYIPYSLRNRDEPKPDRSASRSPSRESLAPPPPPPSSSVRRSASRAPINSSIREGSSERGRKKSIKERTARRASRQNSLQESSSSDDEEIATIMRRRSRSGSAHRRRLKKRSSTDGEKPPPPQPSSSMQSSLYETGAEEQVALIAESIQSLANSTHNESDAFQSCAASPLLPNISRSSSKNGVVKNQIIKSPSLVEVHGLPRTESKSSIKPSESSSRLDDESQYSAIVHFKPNKVKRVAPVPGLWKSGAENEEFISRNKRFRREEATAEVESNLEVAIVEKVALTCKAGARAPKKAIVEKKKVILTRQKKVEEKAEASKKDELLNKVEVQKKPEAVPKKEKLEASKKNDLVESKKPEVVKKKDEVKVEPKKAEVQKKPEVAKKVEALKKEEPKKPEVVNKKKDEVKVEPKKAEVQKKPEVVNKKNDEVKVEPKKVEIKKNPDPKKAEVKKPMTSTKNESAEIKEKSKHQESKAEAAQKPIDAKNAKSDATKPKQIEKLISEETTQVNKVFSKRSWTSQKAERTIKLMNKIAHIFKCKSSKVADISISEHYRRRPIGERATVLVDTPTPDVNYSVVRMKIRATCKPKTKIEEIPTASEADVSRCTSRASTRASVILDEMRYTEAAVDWVKDHGDHEDPDVLILPDQSILEQYVNRKLERLRRHRPSSMCSSRGYESSNCASPCPSTVSELCQPSSIIVDAPRRQHNSAEPEQRHLVQLTSAPRGFNKQHVGEPVVVKPVAFEAPKTLFERMIQEQANRNRNPDQLTRDASPRRGSSQEEGMSSLSQQFASSAAANNPHSAVRYAAHIPVNRVDSGRTSAASVDSQQSGILDVASKSIDHVIDQARHRHHQHRSKFKEAIDYLDQIFEDLKKECDTDEKNNNSNENADNGVDHHQKRRTSAPLVAAAAAKVIDVKKTTTTAAAPPKTTPQTRKVVGAAKKSTVPSKVKVSPPVVEPATPQKSNDSPVEIVIPVRKISSEEPIEPTVAETIVLAKKTDKMDFTRRWLHDDLSSLAHLPPANIAPNASYYQDFDEHSLGSCSAEVAAFNTTKEKRKASRKASDASEPPLRPRPFRPQPVYPILEPTNGSAFETYASSTLPRVTSTDHMSAEMRRSGSQDPYSTLRSMRSEGDPHDRPSPSAFQQVGSRASLRSLPDHSPIRQRVARQQQPPHADPILSIDQLVAELELNTEPPPATVEKRRSFPTQFIRHNGNEYERPNRYRAEIRPATIRGRGQTIAAGGGAASSSLQKQQKSLDEVTSMLNNVASQFGVESTPRTHPSVFKQLSASSNHSQNAFETINQEKINPSRVEAMHTMFEKGTAWKMHQPYKQKSREDSLDETAPRKQSYSKVTPPQEAQYATLHSYSPSATTNIPARPTYHEYTPQLPTTQPPQHPPGSANSSTGGYYSSNSSGIGSQPNPNQRRSLLIDQQSICSRVPSVDEDDDGFYDNIGIYDDRRMSRGSELEACRQLPPSSKHNRIGSFLRKIGGGSSRPPGSAASLMSLNKIANETVMKPAGLMKSNSLSTEPWKKQVLMGNLSREPNNNHHHHHQQQQKTGLGARLKNTLFGSRKRLDG
ncbi:unnamed protein product [Caenorhabditis bovis]|uniref:Uncharacterized protein n=1 Tax=Caenorhabditis bovis TaxID=2654633 RepID=A0A8S1FDF7_9PELO|nr:unnamed protein product [Caenorhabditis bovis]